MTTRPQPWIGGAGFDLAFILSPALLVTAAVLAFHDFFTAHAVTPLLWALLIVGVDVGHVYSTLYRTYFDATEFARRRTLYVLAPLLGFLGFAALYSLGPMAFWRVLAYLAAFHFVRQQYGFMMIYGRFERQYRAIDQAAIYGATLAPLIWWHTHRRQFAWFMDGDFVHLALPWLGQAALAAYALVLAAYAIKELRLTRCHGLNWPRNLLLAGTVLSWGVGIIVLDSDLAFTATNVLAHGIPYVALVWLFGRSRSGPVLGLVPRSRAYAMAALPLFLTVPLLLAYLEEGLWDGFIWGDHPRLFPVFSGLPRLDQPDLLTWLVPLLALPQITHYILDGFIWKDVGRVARPAPVVGDGAAGAISAD